MHYVLHDSVWPASTKLCSSSPDCGVIAIDTAHFTMYLPWLNFLQWSDWLTEAIVTQEWIRCLLFVVLSSFLTSSCVAQLVWTWLFTPTFGWFF